MKMRKKIDELLDKHKDLFTRRWNPGQVWTLVKCVQDNVKWLWIGNCEHIPETSHHLTIAGILYTIVVRRMKVGEDVATRTGLSRKLDEERGEEVASVLFTKVPEIEIEVSH